MIIAAYFFSRFQLALYKHALDRRVCITFNHVFMSSWSLNQGVNANDHCLLKSPFRFRRVHSWLSSYFFKIQFDHLQKYSQVHSLGERKKLVTKGKAAKKVFLLKSLQLWSFLQSKLRLKYRCSKMREHKVRSM